MGLDERFLIERAWKQGPGISDGSDVEKAILGRVTPPNERDEYMPFESAVAMVKEYQPSVFERSVIIRELRSRVAEKCVNKDDPVRFFTAVGTPLDTYHGVDAFFEQGNRRVTVDVSMRPKVTYKADVLMAVAMDQDGIPVVVPQEMERVAAEIAQKLTLQ